MSAQLVISVPGAATRAGQRQKSFKVFCINDEKNKQMEIFTLGSQTIVSNVFDVYEFLTNKMTHLKKNKVLVYLKFRATKVSFFGTLGPQTIHLNLVINYN